MTLCVFGRALRWKRVALLLVAALLILAIIFHRVWLVGLADYLMDGDYPQKADLIAVLGGDAERVIYGVKLYQAGYAPHISFTGDAEDLILLKTTFQDMARRYAETEGIESAAILTARATSTFEETQQVARLAHENGFRSVLIVTSPYHLRRAHWIFSRTIRGVKLYFTAVPLAESHFRFPDWWHDEQSAIWVMEEYVKLGFYVFKYGF